MLDLGIAALCKCVVLFYMCVCFFSYHQTTKPGKPKAPSAPKPQNPKPVSPSTSELIKKVEALDAELMKTVWEESKVSICYSITCTCATNEFLC